MPVVQKSNKTPEWVEGSVTVVKTDCLPPRFWGSGQFLAMRDGGPFYERHHITSASKAIHDSLLFPRQKCSNIGTVQYEILAIYPPPSPYSRALLAWGEQLQGRSRDKRFHIMSCGIKGMEGHCDRDGLLRRSIWRPRGQGGNWVIGWFHPGCML